MLARDAEMERRRKEQEKAIKTAQEKTQNDFLKSLVDNKLTDEMILGSNLEAFGSGSKEQFIGMLKRHNTEDRIKTNPNVAMDLWSRIHLPDGDPKKLVDENDLNQYYGKGLDLETINQFRGEIQGKKTTQGQIESDMKARVLKAAEDRLVKANPAFGIKDPVGQEQYLKFMGLFLNEYEAQKKKGKSPLELLIPGSPDYLGKYLDQFTRTPREMMQDQVKMLKGQDGGLAAPAPGATPAAPAKAPDPRQPGESAADYLKRIGKVQ